MKNKQSSMTIQNCQLYGVKWDQPAIDVLGDIATAISKEAEAANSRANVLASLGYLLKASNVQIETMIKVDGFGNANVKDKKHE